MNVIIDELERKKSPGEVLDVLIPDEATLLGLDLDGILQDLEVYMTNKQKQLHESVRQLTSAPPIRWPISELQAIRGTLQEYLTPFEERETGSQDDGRLEKPAECSGEGEGYLVSDTSLETGEVRGRMSAKELLSQLKELDEKKARIMASISLLEKIQSLNDSLDTLREAMKDKDYAKINVLVDTINALAEVLGNQDELRDIIYRKELIFEDLKVCIKEELVTLMEARVQNGCHNGEQDISEASASLGPVVNPLAAVSVSGPFANRPESVARRGSGSLTLSNGIGGLLNSARKGTLAGLNAAGLGPRPSLDVLPNSAGARSSSGDLDGAQVSGAVAPSGNPQVVEAEALSSRLESVQLMCKLCRGVHSEPYTREENRIYDLIYQILLKLDSHLYDKIIADRINTILAEYEVQFDYKYNYKTKQDRINEALTQIKVFYKRLAWINHTLAAYKALLLPANLRSTTICAKKPVVNEDGIGSGVLNLFLIKFISVTKQHLINILDLAYTQIDHVQLYKLVVDVKQLQTLLDHIYDFHGTYKYDSATGQAAFSERSCSVKLPSLMNIFDAFTTPWLQNYDKSFSGVIRSAMNSKDEVEFFNDGTCSLYEGVGLALAHVPRRVFKSALSLSDSIVKMTQDAVRAGVAQMEQDTEITVTKYLNNYLDIGWITLSRWRKFILDENHPMRQSAGRLLDWNCTEMIEARTRTITQNYGNKLNIPYPCCVEQFTDLLTLISSLELLRLNSKRIIAAGGDGPSCTVPSTTVPSTIVPSTTGPSTTVPSTTGPSTIVPSTTTSWILRMVEVLMYDIWELQYAATMTLFRHLVYSTFAPMLPECYYAAGNFNEFLSHWQHWVELVGRHVSPALNVVIKDTTVLLYCRYIDVLVEQHKGGQGTSETRPAMQLGDKILLDATAILEWITADSSCIVGAQEIGNTLAIGKQLLAF